MALPNAFHLFFNLFDNGNWRSAQLSQSFPENCNKEQVAELFKWVKINKAQDPNGICGRTSHFCANQLWGIFQPCFSAVWILSQSSTVVVQHLNDYKPVALTSFVIKLQEKIIKALILNVICILDQEMMMLNCLSFRHYMPMQNYCLPTSCWLVISSSHITMFRHLSQAAFYSNLVTFSNKTATIKHWCEYHMMP